MKRIVGIESVPDGLLGIAFLAVIEKDEDKG
jgi:hypothetical protein